MNKNLRDFIQAAKALGPDYYVEVNRPLSSYLEVSIIQQKLARLGRNPMIYCPEIEGSKLPLVTNLFGSFEMLALGLGCDPRTTSREAVYDVVRKKATSRIAPEWVPASLAPVKQVKLLEDDVDLGVLPIIHNSKLDAGKYISVGFMIAKWPDTGALNAGIYRHLVMGRDLLGCMINPGNDAAYIARAYAELDQVMEVALVVGHHPAVVQASLVRNAAELELMGSYLGEPLEVTKGETVDLPIPAHAEIVIEGFINPKKMSTDGPFAEYLGYYGVSSKPCYLIQVTAITMREDAIYHHLDSAHPEHNLSSSLVDTVALYDKLKRQFPTLKAVTNGWLGTYISLRQRVAGEGRQAALVAVAENYGKTAVAVDDDIDIYDEREVAWAIATRMVADEDLLVLPGVKGAHLDPVAYNESRTGRGPMTTRLIIDATKPVEREFEIKTEPDARLWKTMKLEDYLDKPYLK